MTKNVAQKLMEARVKAEVLKTGTNAFAKYTYYQIDMIYAEAKKIFAEVGLVTVERVDIFAVEGKIYKKFFLDVINTDKIDEKLTFESTTEPNSLNGAQACQEAGADITYMTKYLYGLALMLDDGKSDVDATNTHKEQPAKKSLSRTELKNKIDALPKDKFDKYMNKLMQQEGRTTPLSTTYWKQAFMNEVAKEEGWV